MHAWAKLDAADETWLVASSARYSLVAGQIQRSAMGQLALTAMLLVALPLAGWSDRAARAAGPAGTAPARTPLAESQKMEAIGKLAGGVAHDFNNMLTAILGYASMIQEDAPPKSAIRDQALQIRRAAENAASLTQKLLAFSRKQVLHSDPVDFRSMLGNLLALVRGAIGADITVTTHMGEELWPILADPVQLEQSMVNLAINARDAMPNGGTLQISARNAPRPNGERRPDADVKPGDYVQITVTDTGSGMDEATRTRMFEPFFTTKAPGQGHRPRPVDRLRVRAAVRRLHRRDVDAGTRHVDRTAVAARARRAAVTPDTRRRQSKRHQAAARKRCCWPRTKRACASWRSNRSSAAAIACWPPRVAKRR